MCDAACQEKSNLCVKTKHLHVFKNEGGEVLVDENKAVCPNSHSEASSQ